MYVLLGVRAYSAYIMGQVGRKKKKSNVHEKKINDGMAKKIMVKM